MYIHRPLTLLMAAVDVTLCPNQSYELPTMHTHTLDKRLRSNPGPNPEPPSHIIYSIKVHSFDQI